MEFKPIGPTCCARCFRVSPDPVYGEKAVGLSGLRPSMYTPFEIFVHDSFESFVMG